MVKYESLKDVRIWLVVISLITFFVMVFKGYPAN
jgi:hypothetical protein